MLQRNISTTTKKNVAATSNVPYVANLTCTKCCINVAPKRCGNMFHETLQRRKFRSRIKIGDNVTSQKHRKETSLQQH